MVEYRVYCLSSGGLNVEAKSITASSDEEAIQQVRALDGLRQCEIWRGKHQVATVTDFHGGAL
jgi:hypothetical protein